jgi:hypothetical protein
MNKVFLECVCAITFELLINLDQMFKLVYFTMYLMYYKLHIFTKFETRNLSPEGPVNFQQFIY